MKKSLLISGAVLGALTIGSQGVNADTVDVNDGTSTSISQPSTQPNDTGSTTLPPASSSTSDTVVSNSGSSETDNTVVDDGTSVNNVGSGSSGTQADMSASESSSTTNNESSSSTATDSGSNSQSGTDTDSASSTTIDVNSGSSVTDTGSENSSSPSANTVTDNNSTPSNLDVAKLPYNGRAPEVVPLTPTTPDVNEKGQLNQVAPVSVAQPNNGEAPIVPEHVATVPSVARAVEAYNATLSSNNSDATQAPVVEAKKKVDEAVQQALPKTGVHEQRSGVGIVGIALTALASGLGLIFKKKIM